MNACPPADSALRMHSAPANKNSPGHQTDPSWIRIEPTLKRRHRSGRVFFGFVKDGTLDAHQFVVILFETGK